MENFFKLLKDSILPPFCIACGKISLCYLCDSCMSAINVTGENTCLSCGRPFSEPHEEPSCIDKKISQVKLCNLCKTESFYFYKSRSFAFYEGIVAEMIKNYKYRKYYFLKDILAGFLKTAYKSYYHEEKIDYIETVPDIVCSQGNSGLSKAQKYGASHMDAIAERLSVFLNIPYAGNIKKTRKTIRQQTLDRSGRKLNVSCAFKVINRMQAQLKNYLVIDDVWTTGSTLNEVSRALKNAGADKIYLLTIARGI